MIAVPASIQSQLGETISLIADSDFWTRWDTLVDVRRKSTAKDIQMLMQYRIWFLVCLPMMQRSTLVCWRSHIPYSSDGGHSSHLMVSTPKSTMYSVNSASLSSSCLQYVTYILDASLQSLTYLLEHRPADPNQQRQQGDLEATHGSHESSG